MSDFTTIEFEDYNHQHKLLQFFAKHATIIPTHSSRIKPKYLFDSNNKIVEIKELDELDFTVSCIHSELTQSERFKILNSFNK